MMKITDIGEFGLIHRITPPFTQNLPDGIVGIGDDCAAIPWQDDTSLLVTTDMLIEDIHFLRKRISPRDLGYKSLAVNLSDIAAMGGTPESAFLSLGIPKDIDIDWLDEFYAGLHDLAESSRVYLLGGDTTKSPDKVVINLTVLGKALTRNIKYRSTAIPGDIICVTDVLGDSGGGLKCMLEDRPTDDEVNYLIQRHHHPRPHLSEGVWLAKQDGVNAMMDVSDGIDSDLQRIMERSQCGAEVHLEHLPISSQLQNVSRRFGWRAPEIAVAGGEDYCLLTTIAPQQYPAISEAFAREFQRPLFNIGVVTAKESGLRYTQSGKPVELGKHGFDHFISTGE